MGKFEIEVTLLSFIWAIAITHILQGFRDLWIARDRVMPSVSHLLWMSSFLLGAVFSWLPLASANGHLADWVFSCLVVYACSLYFAAAFASPELPESGQLDLSAYEARHGHAYKASFLLMMAMAVALNIGIYDSVAGKSPSVGVLLPGVPAVVAVISLVRRERWVRTLSAALIFTLALALFVLNVLVN